MKEIVNVISGPEIIKSGPEILSLSLAQKYYLWARLNYLWPI